MSTPIPATEVANVPVGDAASNAAEEAEEHTPEAVKVDPPEPSELPDPTDGDGGLDEIRNALAAAGDRIAQLEDAVTNLQKPDEVPVKKKPWTQRGRKS